MSVEPPAATPVTESASGDVEVHDNDNLEQFVERALEIRYQVNARSRSKLGINSEVVVELEAIPRIYGEDLVRLAVRSARTHPRDKYVLMEDVHWARARLVSGAGRSTAPQILTTLGGLIFGIGAPIFLGALTTVTDATPVVTANVAMGAGISLVGAVLLTWGIVLTARRN